MFLNNLRHHAILSSSSQYCSLSFLSRSFATKSPEPKQLHIPLSKNQRLKNSKIALKKKQVQKYDVQGKAENLELLGYKRFDRMLTHTGLTTRSLMDRFLKDNDVRVEEARMTQPDRIRRYVDPQTVTVNGQHIPYLDPITIALWKPAKVMAYAATKAPRKAKDVIRLQNEGYEDVAHIYNTILPEEFQYRRPPFEELMPLQPDQTGLQVLSQKQNFLRRSKQTTLPLKRTYIVEVQDNLTGLELDAFKFFRADTSVPMPDPVMEQISEKVARISLYDAKPDNLREILLSIRHQPISIHRVEFGGLSILEGHENIDLFKENEWVVLEERQEKEMIKELKHRKEWQERKLRTQHLINVERERKMREIEERERGYLPQRGQTNRREGL